MPPVTRRGGHQDWERKEDRGRAEFPVAEGKWLLLALDKVKFQGPRVAVSKDGGH